MRIPSTAALSRTIPVALVFLTIVYVAQLAGPLRLDTDSASYLQIAASIADGHGAHPAGVPAFPVGYPILVAGLDVAGLGTSRGIVALNLAFIALAIASLWVVLRRGLDLGATGTGVICVMTLLSSSLVKHAVIPLSEAVFFGLAAASLALLTIAARRGQKTVLVGAILLAGAACSVRTAGIALAPAVVLAFTTARSRLGASLVVVAAAALVVATTPRYLDELTGGWKPGLLTSAGREGHDLLVLVGASIANVPQSKLDAVARFVVVIGAAALCAIAAVVVMRRRSLGPVDGWVIGSLLLLYIWPSDALRFMLPIFPFLLGYGALLARRWRAAAIGYATLFALLGLVAIAISTRITFAGDAFPERYAGGVLAPTYRVAWGLARPGDQARVESPVLDMLRRYDPDPPGRR